MLDEPSYTKLFFQSDSDTPPSDIVFISKILMFLILGDRTVLAKEDGMFWRDMMKYYSQFDYKIGTVIKTSLEDLRPDFKSSRELFQFIEGKEGMISPSSFSQLCGTTGLITFTLRDALFHLGLMFDTKSPNPGEVIRFLSLLIQHCEVNLNVLNGS